MSPRLWARIAGFLYLIVIIGGAYDELFVCARLVISPSLVRTLTQ